MGGDQEEDFDALYRQTCLPVYRFLRRRLPEEQARDALGEVYLTAWRRRDRLWREAPVPWLYGIARLVLRNGVRADARSQRLREALREAANVPSHTSGAGEDAVERMRAAQVLAGLAERDREVLMLIAWEGMEIPAAARVMGCSPATFSVRLHRARKRLEQALREEEPTARLTGPWVRWGRQT